MALYPITNLGLKYANGMQVSYATTTTLGIAAGQVRDSTNIRDITLSDAIVLDAGVNGINGLDTGDLANSTWYYVYAIQDPSGFQVDGTILSLEESDPSTTLPSGYSVFRLIGMALTDGSAHFLKFYMTGDSNYRQYFWDAEIAVLTSGTATTLTAISLIGAVPVIDKTAVTLVADYTPATAGDTVSFATFGSTATVLPHVTGSVAAKATTGQLKVLSVLNSSLPKILYINSASAGDADVWVSGFDFYV